MTRALAILSLCAVACTTTQARRVRADCPPCSETARAPCAVKAGMVQQALPVPPSFPDLGEVAPGCPAAFIHCLTPEKNDVLERYVKAIREWKIQVYRQGVSSDR